MVRVYATANIAAVPDNHAIWHRPTMKAIRHAVYPLTNAALANVAVAVPTDTAIPQPTPTVGFRKGLCHQAF